MSNKPSPPVGIALTVLSGLLVAGILTFAAPCGVHDDGSVSSCFWAGRAVLGVDFVLLILSVVRIFELDEGERRGLDLGAALIGVLAACLPGVLIDLCMMQSMRCQTIMRPFCMVVGIAIALVAGIDLIVRLLRIRSAK
jgi:hypothetical protein